MNNTFSPVADKNAIVHCGFGIIFDRPIPLPEDQLIKKIGQVKERLGYSFHKTLHQAEFVINEDKSFMDKLKPHGFAVGEGEDENKPNLDFIVDGHSVASNCYNYSRWATIAPKCIESLIAGIDLLQACEMKVSRISLVVLDKFISEKPVEQADFSNFLSEESRYFTKYANPTRKDLWHIHQGWFEKSRSFDNAKLHNSINIDVNKGQKGNCETLILNQISYFWENVTTSPKYSEISSRLISLFDDLHIINKQIMLDILDASMSKRIGLEGTKK